jgi:1-acyl-sn-glycerol-3-phosphate acyltransferase
MSKPKQNKGKKPKAAKVAEGGSASAAASPTAEPTSAPETRAAEASPARAPVPARKRRPAPAAAASSRSDEGRKSPSPPPDDRASAADKSTGVAATANKPRKPAKPPAASNVNGTAVASVRRVEPLLAPASADESFWGDELAPTATLAEDGRVSPVDLSGAMSERAAVDAPSTSRLARGSENERLRERAAFGSAESLLSTDYYFRQYGAHGMRSLTAEIDDFGFDPHVDEKVRPLLEGLCKRYFRVEVVGIENLPQDGRALLVANRSGALPWDGLVLRTALRAQRADLAPLRWLSEDSVIHYPFMGVLMNRLGAVRACPENAERLLAQNRLVAVFPEGAQGSRKLFRDRYRLQRFGRGGYVKLALKFEVPIIPTAIIGGEETNPVLGRSRLLGKLLGSESLPLTPTFPWLGPAGLLPAPVKWRIVIGEPIDLSGHGAKSADDALIVHRLNEQIRSSLQALVDRGKRSRGAALFG